MAVLETPIRHVSDVIHWIDRTGYAAEDHQPLAAAPLRVVLDNAAPDDLRLTQKPGRTLLWRRYAETGPGADLGAATMTRGVGGRASREQMTRPPEQTYTVSARVEDPSGRYQPRMLAIDAGNLAGHPLPLYRTPAATAFPAAGGLLLHLRWSETQPASWAIAALTVTPPVGAALQFTAQADAAGDLLLPLSRLPALTRDAPATTYPATLSVTADAALGAADIPNPDAFSAVELLAPSDGSQGPSASIAVTPGAVTRITSQGEDHLALRQT